MKKRNTAAILAALLLLTACTGCGASEDYFSKDAAEEMYAPAEGGAALKGDVAGAPDAAVPKAEENGAMEEAEGDADEVAFEAEMAGDMAAAVDAAIDIMPEVEAPVPDDYNSPAEVGVLTAGEWRDHDNWGFFSNLVNSGTIQFPSFGIDPRQRIAVSVKNSDGVALPNAAVQLLSEDGTVMWRSVTDKNGTAYVFETNGQNGNHIEVSTPDGMTGSAVLEPTQSDSQDGSASVTDRMAEMIVEATPVLYQNTQIMFIVDTTGSMGDEMLYLQSDFGAIAEETGDDYTSYAVSFYKDEGDKYVTRIGNFTSDVQNIRSQLNAESADGGGDEPEAVAEALSESFSMDGWMDDSVKIAFLIYDAPPHSDKRTMLQDAIASASEQGIHIVPVVSSNGSRDTELFGRAAAICTNGSYVFLTDDSGVGSSHLEPIIGDYEVEKLHDVIVRIINDYKQY